ncbi:MAG: lysozyme inhibitor LprI family protein [Thermoanaerobaculia bacterium]
MPADGLLAAETPPPAAAEPDSAAEGRRYPVQHCWDAFEASEWGKMTDCLQDSLKQQEVALKEAIDQAAAQAGQSMDKQSALSTLEKSNAKWVAYRDSECDRQLAFVAGRNHPDIGELTCKIRQTVQRIADLKFDE